MSRTNFEETTKNPGAPTNTPIFLFSAGWRSGSTLVQRAIMAAGNILMWGEPGGALDHLADAYDALSAQWATEGTFRSGAPGRGKEQFKKFITSPKEERPHLWIANLGPNPDQARVLFRNLLLTLYEDPARRLGYRGWGIKEVRSGIRTARFLQELFPNARFVWLVRNPLAALTSIKRRNWLGHASDRDPASRFASHWRDLAAQFRQADFGMWIRYEDFVSDPECRRALSRYLGIGEISDAFIRASRADWKVNNKDNLSWAEHRRIRAMLRQEMRAYGYH